MSVETHKKEAPDRVKCAVITISDTRNEETDKSGRLMKDYITDVSHEVISYRIVKDEQDQIESAIEAALTNPEVDVVLTNGGTGIAPRDVTIEVVQGLLDKELVGFGEIFRMLSYTEDIGSAAILSRAIAGVSRDTAIFSTPGSSGAVKLAMEKLILPEMAHVVREIRKS
ncbi:MogA/MoaB family molybdenum cofactor biosynthesis protein [Thalassobacillus hwangdonensis]|uniref:Molybdenum cofactor biosynthesis protein B n=1 Tax=Thalassobacillus hwangdonensis TaxID=546108 RepID=A0ABW3L1Q5_9BACI